MADPGDNSQYLSRFVLDLLLRALGNHGHARPKLFVLYPNALYGPASWIIEGIGYKLAHIWFKESDNTGKTEITITTI
mgnify:CR=1 FL=1